MRGLLGPASPLLILVILAAVVTARLQAQPSVLNGVVNAYTRVTAIDSSCSQPMLTVVTTTGFYAGEKAILIQMKDATVPLGNAPDFGTIQSLNSSGLYEVVTIDSVNRPFIRLRYSLLNA